MKKLLNILLCAVLIAAAAVFCESEEVGPASGECAAGEWKCSEDAYVLYRCEDGAWTGVECMRGEGRLCENNACVDPWRYGSPLWRVPESDGHYTAESLSGKAAYYEDIAARLHVNPGLKYMTTVYLPCRQVECGPGETAPCLDCTEPEVPEETATWADVERFEHHDNDGLFSALYLTAEAFRYGATRDPQALEMIRLLLAGEVDRMSVTGVPGLFTRSYIPPGVNGVQCPDDPNQYIHDVVEGHNQYVLIGDDGCARIYDGAKKEWKTTDHCVPEKYAGWCWVDNVSKDEYAGHMLALGAVSKLVDDPQSQAIAEDLISKVAKHLIKNKMEVVDWDGRVTSYGRIHAATLDDYTGLNAGMALDFIKIAAEVTGDPKIARWYDDCLLQKHGKKRCLGNILESPKPYTRHLPHNGIFVGENGCMMNYDNNSMHVLSMHNLIWFEHDPDLREVYQKSLDEDMFRAGGEPRALAFQNNAFYDFVFAAQKRLGPGSDGPAFDTVSNGIAMLKRFPPRYHYEEIRTAPEDIVNYCEDRFGQPTAEFAHAPDQRCPDNVMLWTDPYRYDSCRKNRRIVLAPTDYLLPYWMGRYYGFISPDM